MKNRNVNWLDIWKIYQYHLKMVSLIFFIVCLILAGLVYFASIVFSFPFTLILKPPYSFLTFIILMLIQIYPVNMYVLRYKTLRKKFKGWHVLVVNNEDIS